MDDEQQPTTTTPAPAGGGRRRMIYTAALATGLALGGFGIASAQTDTPDTTTPPTEQAPAVPDLRDGRLGLRLRGGPGHGPGGFGLMDGRGALHGELVVPDGDGEGYRTAVVQRGEVTAVDASSLTVKSEDGFTETYTVDDNTLVNAGNEGIGDVEVGDDVGVRAFVEDGSDDPHAAHVFDATGVREIHRHWHPQEGADAEGSAG